MRKAFEFIHLEVERQNRKSNGSFTEKIEEEREAKTKMAVAAK